MASTSSGPSTSGTATGGAPPAPVALRPLIVSDTARRRERKMRREYAGKK